MKQIVVHGGQGLTKIALLEDRQLVEFYIERPEDKQLVGNIYKGKVVNVLPGMQAAFVDIGSGRNAFLYVDDLLPAHLEKQPKVKPGIAKLVKEGQELMVQVTKEPVASKGAKVTTHFSLAGRWAVYMPEADYVGVSRKIMDEEERNRLKTIGEQLRKSGEGIILRTVAAGESRESLSADLHELRRLWQSIVEGFDGAASPCCLYKEPDMIQRLVRDIFTDQVDELIVDDAEKGREIIELLEKISSESAAKVRIYSEQAPIFQKYGVYEELEKSLKPKIWLKSGGFIYVDQTEALTVIDVNTGKFTGSVDLEQTVLQTNLEAAEQISRLLRLRDIGGIIIVDFIDMNSERHRDMIVERMESFIRLDRTKTLVVGWTKLGLLEITRKKVRSQMESFFFETCSACGGLGKVFKESQLRE
ncbi:Rne/Rng family ribonuclease [Ferviditalea candida]|uniref:Rne/Rng family ribonuclease n=1 Tax=Ferviditalea candida TaxID=3108399 RepID=A0ABU5ZCY6_9BACL|nr:Rne/Rng family ribonuclease [Paenibacillaceae bacterium T2]